MLRNLAPADLSPADAGKRAAAAAAVALVAPGMRLGLGTGSTSDWFLDLLAARVREERLDVICVSTSARTGERAERLGLIQSTLDAAGPLDMTVDGADEVAPDLSLIKGGGGALLREKIVATASARMVVIADAAKRVRHLGAFALPVEIVPFGWETTQRLIVSALGPQVRPRLRMAGREPVLTDGGHFIVDLALGAIADPGQVADTLLRIAGVVETGLFVGIAERAIFGAADGTVSVLTRDGAGA